MNHGITGYNRGCRCDMCRAARSDSNRRHYRQNREKMLAQGKAWREANPERVLAQRKCYYLVNREKLVAKQELYRKANPEKVLARVRAYRAADPERLRVRARRYRERIRAELARHLGEKCVECGATEGLQLDHIDPSTKSERLKGRPGKHGGSIVDLPKSEMWAEVVFCQLLCTEHHREKTNRERRAA